MRDTFNCMLMECAIAGRVFHSQVSARTERSSWQAGGGRRNSEKVFKRISAKRWHIYVADDFDARRRADELGTDPGAVAGFQQCGSVTGAVLGYRARAGGPGRLTTSSASLPIRFELPDCRPVARCDPLRTSARPSGVACCVPFCPVHCRHCRSSSVAHRARRGAPHRRPLPRRTCFSQHMARSVT